MKCSNCKNEIEESELYAWEKNLKYLGWSLWYCKTCSDLWDKSLFASKWNDKILAAQELEARKKNVS